ncbi:SDR family NAD(P)-dependent oxidoreductase [Geofilum sp. OHC36d9]|uniref:SDR family NAD(P)-dependent oxidoreductase n=1 Tax=Geofilum sp. OHC36d9 TaxID=3458413 RepID=UPI00403456D7
MTKYKVLVTGAGNGIGRAIAEMFYRQDCLVRIVDKDERGLAYMKDKYPRMMIHVADVASEKEILHVWSAVEKEWGYCDILINNAGISRFTSLPDTSTDNWDEILDVNLRAPFIFAREFARRHPRQQFGRIVNIASTRYVMSEPGGEAYGASKGGLVSLTHALANSLAGTAITVNCIAPGWIHTGDYAELSRADHAQHLSGRVGKPEDIAAVVKFLCQPDSDFINGEEIRVDGGMTRKMIYL